ncbi:hypothetical protein [Megasphaera sp.]|uniref:hypothetical protein n=1 Tax=Megasphaera sp. TaxID=2023260 RepID=UPI003521A8C0
MNEQITREAMKKEAERRIKMLNLHPNAVQEFIEEGRLNRSDRTRIVSPFGKQLIGALFWLNDEEKQLVAQIEKEWDIYVYHMTHESFEFGECYDMLYVSRYSDEWEADRMDLKDGFPVVYVCNATAPDLSEFGHIGIKAVGGGIIRTM